MRNREKVHEWIDRYNNQDLLGEERDIFLEMIRRDARLREEVWLDKELNHVLKEADMLELRRKIRRVISEDPHQTGHTPMILLLAASLLILLSVEYTIYYFTRSGREPLKSAGIQTIDKGWKDSFTGVDQQLIAANQQYVIFQSSRNSIPAGEDHMIKGSCDLLSLYTPDPAMENLTGMTCRSGGFQMLRPASNAVFTLRSILWFSWKTENQTETGIVVENNSGISVYESDLNCNQSLLLKASFLGQGLFYYKIVNKEEVIYVGKFRIM